MNIVVKKLKTYFLEMTEDQAKDLLYFVIEILHGKSVAINGRQSETCSEIQQALLSSGLKCRNKEPE